MPLTKSETLAPWITERDRLRAIPSRTPEEKDRLRFVAQTINEVRGKEDEDPVDVQDELTETYGTLRDIESLSTWGGDPTERAERSEAWDASVVRLIQARDAGDLLVDAATAKQPTEKRLRSLIRRYAKGDVKHAPDSVVERAHDLGEHHFGLTVDGRPSEKTYAAEASTIDASTPKHELEALKRHALAIGQRADKRAEKRREANA